MFRNNLCVRKLFFFHDWNNGRVPSASIRLPYCLFKRLRELKVCVHKFVNEDTYYGSYLNNQWNLTFCFKNYSMIGVCDCKWPFLQFMVIYLDGILQTKAC